MKRKGDGKKNGLIHTPPCCRELRKENKKKMCSFLNTFGRIEERKEGEELEKIGYGGLLD